MYSNETWSLWRCTKYPVGIISTDEPGFFQCHWTAYESDIPEFVG